MQLNYRWIVWAHLSSCLLLLSACEAQNSGIQVEHTSAASGHEYTILKWNSGSPDWTTERPSAEDETVLLCVAAAFTQQEENSIDGLWSDNGSMRDKPRVNRNIGGGCLIKDGELLLLNTKGEVSLDSAFTAGLQRDVDFFQQILCVIDGQAEKFRDTKMFQRRAICTMNDGSEAVIETVKSATLAQFSVDLVELGVNRALYTDMGGWDEGWYRYGDGVIPIGRMKTATGRQTNWFVIKQ